METYLMITGVLLIVLGVLHLGFPRYFNWKKDLAVLELFNRQVMYVHTYFIGFVVFLMGLLCVSSTKDLLYTPLGKRICMGLAIFWLVRLIVQFFGYSSTLWKGKRFETVAHILFSILWFYLVVIFGVAGYST